MATNQTEQARTLPQMMAELQELMGAPVQQFKSDMQAAQAITPIDPNILREAVQSGGALSTAQDFATSDAWAMTPEMFKMQMANRPDVGKQIGEVTTLSDAIFGRTNQRKSMEAIAQANLGLSQKVGEMAQRGYEAQTDRAHRTGESALDRAAAAKLQKDRLEAQAKEGAADRGLRAQLAREEQQLRRALAKVTYASSGGQILAEYQAKGIPVHSQESEKTIGSILAKDPSKLDPTVLYQAKLKGLEMGMLGADGTPVKLKSPNAGWFEGSETYVVRLEPKKQIPYVFKLNSETGKYDALKPVSRVVPSKVLSSGASGSNLTSGPAYLMNE